MLTSKRRRIGGKAVLLLASLVLGMAGTVWAQDLADESKRGIDRGSGWLVAHQNPDGGYGPYGEKGVFIPNTSDVGITAFCLYALARNPRGYKAVDGPFISKAVDFLLARQQSDGAFYDKKDPTLQNYKTCVVLLALVTFDPAKYSGAIAKAQNFIKAQQATEALGYDPEKHVTFGGQGYGEALTPDLSNSQFSAEALYGSGLSGSDEYWKRLAVFISRCQNSKTVDPLLKEVGIGTTGDGGFRYAPNATRGPVETLDTGVRVFSSYGSMTYAGLKSLLHARVNKDDERVQQAFAWISRNFTVRENPGMATKANPRAGMEGLFYYYHTMAKALSIYGEPTIKDAKGVEHDWAKELARQLLSLQNENGSWANASDRWFESIPALGTAYAMVALCECLDFMKATKAKPAAPPAVPASGSAVAPVGAPAPAPAAVPAEAPKSM